MNIKALKLPSPHAKVRRGTDIGDGPTDTNCLRTAIVAPGIDSRHHRHGQCAVMAGEDAEAYGALVERLMVRFVPRDEVEAHLVRRLASIMWRTDRAEQLEADLFSASDRESWRGDRQVHIRFDANRLHALMRYQRDLENGLLKTLAALGMVRNATTLSSAESAGFGSDPDD